MAAIVDVSCFWKIDLDLFGLFLGIGLMVPGYPGNVVGTWWTPCVVVSGMVIGGRDICRPTHLPLFPPPDLAAPVLGSARCKRQH